MTTALAGAGAAIAAEPAAVPTVESTTERVLQSVEVSMGPDGTTTGVGSSVVRTAGGVEDAETSDETYAPQDVVGDLPVRVLTSWRTAEGAGTDLADLQGYSGRIAIDLTVQNLTVKPEMLTYDAAGSSHQQAALVGSPLTVTASTALGDLKPERVVTDDDGSGVNVTNGVLSEGTGGTTVQWAALLAPPVLSSSTEMSLVVDAKDFDVPTFDLSVQPGMVTDPSIGALVDAAFNPSSSDELELQRRTIELITDVNVVLARASDTISDVRTSLTDSAETLGTQTVADLQSSTQTVASNMSSLDSALQSLRGELSSTLETTGSSAIAEMQSAVQTVDKMLGDTSEQPPDVAVDGNGCETTVADPKQAGTVYGSLLQVAGQLDGYAEATDRCKVALQKAIALTIGTDAPTDASCTTAEGDQVKSVTCSLHETQQDFEAAAETLRTDMKEALGLLRSGVYDNAVTAAEELVRIAEGDLSADPQDPEGWGIKELTRRIDLRREALYRALALSWQTLDNEVTPRLDTVATGLTSARDAATAVRTELISMGSQSEAAAAEVCRLVDAGTLTRDEAEKVLGYLVAQSSCTGGPLDPPTDTDAEGNLLYSGPMTTRIDEQIEALDDGLEDSQAAVTALGEMRTVVDDLSIELHRVTTDTDPETNPALKDLLNRLAQKFVELNAQSAVLEREIGTIKDLAAQADAIDQSIDAAVDDAKTRIGARVDNGTRDAVEARDRANEELGTMFERSSSGMTNAAADVVRTGKESVNEQKSAFAKAQEASANRVSSTIEQGLSQIDSGVSSSTRDMEAATTLLIADLRKVLLDLGEREDGGGGLLGAMATNAATARSADYQLGLAADKATSYANVRGRDIDGLMLRQAQTDAAMQMLIEMPAFQLDLPSGSQHRTVFSFSIEDN